MFTTLKIPSSFPYAFSRVIIILIVPHLPYPLIMISFELKGPQLVYIFCGSKPPQTFGFSSPH